MSLSRKIAQQIVEGKTTPEMVISLLTKYHLLALLPSIKRSVEQLRAHSDTYNTVWVESPFPLDEASLARIKRIVGNDLAPCEVKINKDLLAGFKATFKGFVYDGSAKRIIKQLLTK